MDEHHSSDLVDDDDSHSSEDGQSSNQEAGLNEPESNPPPALPQPTGAPVVHAWDSDTDSEDSWEDDYLDVDDDYYGVDSDGDSEPDLRFPFMDLLPELRMIVYAHALNRECVFVPLELCPRRRIEIIHQSALLPKAPTSVRTKQPALVKVNRQVRREALPIYYAENIFDIDNTVVRAGCLYPFFRYPSPESAEALRNIQRLRMPIRIYEEVVTKEADSDPMLRKIIVELDVEVSLKKNRLGAAMGIWSGRAIEKAGESLSKVKVKTNMMTDGQNSFLTDHVKKLFGERIDYDGFDLLRVAATMPGELRSPKAELEWFKLLPWNAEMSINSSVASDQDG